MLKILLIILIIFVVILSIYIIAISILFYKIGKMMTGYYNYDGGGEKHHHKTMKERIIFIVKLIILAVVAAFLFEYLGAKGLLGLIILFTIYALYKTWLSRDIIIGTMRMIEAKLWGKPLDNYLWTKEEWQNRKRIKLIWKKKKKK